jgi:sRNA-binding regulator protein Hfq
MKDTVETDAMERSTEPEGFANRKLIRPVLHRPEHTHGQHPPSHSSNHGNGPNAPSHSHGPNHVSNQNHGTHGSDRRGPSGGKKLPPAETTHAENFYYQKQMQGKTHMVVVLRDGEEVHGVIEWYDRSCLKLNRFDGPNLMIYKPSIKYMYKEGETG